MSGRGGGELREQWTETLAGLVVIALAAVFLVYSLSVGGVGGGRDRYEVIARFGDVGSLAPGADVTVAGVKVGTVSRITLDPKNYLAVTHLSVDRTVKLPADSTAKITSAGLLGGALVSIAPGGAPDDLKPGGEIQNTQGSVDLFGLIGQFINKPSDSGSSAAAGGAPTPGAPAPAAKAGNSAAALPEF
jgi:phospholipid/cholesterol/gamma-HCH transport system substrate-binding protein